MARLFRLAALIAVMFVLAPFAAEGRAAEWWASFAPDESGEVGSLRDITGRRVYLDISFATPDFNTSQEAEAIRQAARETIRRSRLFEIVTVPEGADFVIRVAGARITTPAAVHALNYSAALDADVETPISVTVLVPGSLRQDGTRRPRVVWELSSANVRGEPAPAVGFAVECFIGQVKKTQRANPER
jgi:hypothetical protein